MITRNLRLDAFVDLGAYLLDPKNSQEILEVAMMARGGNSWFTIENVQASIQNIANNLLNEKSLVSFQDKYTEVHVSKKIGVVMAGNIPGVGFHDALCVLLSGHTLLAKLSKDDQAVMLYLLNTLKKRAPSLSDNLSIVDRINAADAYIATGSDNTARYFEYYFASKPHIIRKNRASVAVLSGRESEEEIEGVLQDILLYFGLGCRNVSKIFVPIGYDFSKIFAKAEAVRERYANHHKFFNNYEYNKSILLINRTEHLDNGFIIFTESDALFSPLSVVHYETYTTTDQVLESLEKHSDKIQCVVGSAAFITQAVPFGYAQSPGLFDFADGVDTMEFLQNLG